MLPNRVEDIVDTSNEAEVPKTTTPITHVEISLVQKNIIKSLNEL